MKKYFITATGTDIGKTLVTCALAHQLLAQGKSVRAIKPVISGFKDLSESDSGFLLAAQGLPQTEANLEAISPWRFAAPLSPDMAAQEEGRSTDFARLVDFCDQQDNTDYLLVEGAGGIMTPIDERHTMLDLATALGHPVILIAGSYLGTLSHTLTAARAILLSGLTLHAVIISESETSPVSLVLTKASLSRFLPPATKLGSIARLDSSPDSWKYIPDITQILAI